MSTNTGYGLSYADIRETQLAALDESLQKQVRNIKLVRMRAEEANIERILTLTDVVPLLLPHTAFKSYPESFLAGGKWDRLTKWLGTISSLPTGDVDLAGVEDLDGWVDACGRAGLFVSCSSGTTGKSAMLPASQEDLDFIAQAQIAAVQWGSGIRTGDMRTSAGPAGIVAHTPRNMAGGKAMMEAFVDPAAPRFSSGLPLATIGTLMRMVLLRKKIADGTVEPSELAQFDADSAARERGLAEAQIRAVEDVISKRDKRLLITGMWGALYPFAEAVRARGFSAKDFHPENACYLGGGLKRAKLPDNYREYVFETFNLQPQFIYQMYGMQELNSPMPRCSAGRYHIPPWVVALPLDKTGDNLLDIGKGEIECRAAFFDLSLTSRWGGVISGDRIQLSFEPCECGHASPSIRDNVERFADLEGDDKIACSGTVDAYVRGMS
jgi:hypothetical protein